MRRFLRMLWVGLFAFALCVPSPGPSQPNAEGLSEEALSKLNDLQTLSQQLAQQQGQFAGRTVGPQFASVTNQLQSFLLNFDIWACATAVTAFGIKQRQLAVAAAGAQPPDPALDRAVQDLGNLIAQLQELCNRHVYEMYDGQPAGGAGTAGGTGTPPPVEPPPPTMSVQERICYNRCHELYTQFIRAEFDYDRARREAGRDRQRANDLRRDADQAAERARTARRRAEQTQRDFDRLQAEMTAARTQAERMRIAGQLARLYPESARQQADQAQRAADEAARVAQQAADRAARSEASASLLYDAMMEIYRAWLRCIQACVEQARLHDRVTIDPFELFPGMPRREPQRPPFYRPAPPATAPRAQLPPQQQSARPLDPRSARLLAVHNQERAAVGVTPLQWDPALEQSATAWAAHLARVGRLEHAPREGRGIARENLSSGRIGRTPEQLMQNWLREKSNFVPGIFPNVSRTGRWEDVAHYSQVVWPTTTSVGCGIAAGRGFQWLVCRYSPGGNRDGKPVGRLTSGSERGR